MTSLQFGISLYLESIHLFYLEASIKVGVYPFASTNSIADNVSKISIICLLLRKWFNSIVLYNDGGRRMGHRICFGC